MTSLAGLGAALLVSWVALAVLLIALRPKGLAVGELARVIPDTLRLVRALYRDPGVPRSVRWKLRVALVYNVQPINVIPDVVPVIGFVDNAVVLIWALRSAIRSAGADRVKALWGGTPERLAIVLRAARIPPPAALDPGV